MWCVLHLKNMGVKKIWVKAKSKSHHMILTHLNVEKIIHPEEDMGVRVAQSLSYPMVSRYMALEDDHYIVKIEIHADHHGTPLNQLMKQVLEISTMWHKRGYTEPYHRNTDQILKEGGILLVEVLLEPLRRLAK